MNSTFAPRRIRRTSLWRGLAPLLAFAAARALACDAALPCPPQLEPAVNFWVRVYTQIDTNAGFLHDQYDLRVIYTTLHFAPHSSPWERGRLVARARDRIIAELRSIADGRRPLTPDELRIKALWGAKATRARLLEATHDVRFQLGQSNRFKAGLIRSGAWQQDIARTLAKLGLPPELAALPLVESSYNPIAYSKDGAAGLWQFMPETGRRFMRINLAVDERFDPFRATTAAAQLLAYNYRLLGTWPLAVTAYNHGAAGMLRAVRRLGTTDIVTIIRDYHTPAFGFASRNFYVSLLAALEVERHATRYFGPIVRMPEERFRVLTMPAYVPLVSLERVLDENPQRLRELNPALRPAVWDGMLDVPKGYRMRLPRGGPIWSSALLAQRLGPRGLYASQPIPPSYRVQPGNTLSGIAALYHLSLVELERLNGLGWNSLLQVGERIELPGAALARALPAARSAAPALRAGADAPRSSTAQSMQPDTAQDAQPVSAAQAESLSPALGASGETARTVDPTDYSVAANGTIRVAAAESLGYYAQWLDVSAWDLRRLNHMSFRQPVLIGQRLRLDFRRVSPRRFERSRLAYHRALEADYFASHHIVGTQVYVARRGDSLWALAHRYAQVPSWLLRQYNPDTHFSDLHPGTQLLVPRIEPPSRTG